MLVLDTDHLTELGYRTGPGLRLETRLHLTKQDTVITVVTAEEAIKGRLARLAVTSDVAEQVAGYQHFARTIQFVAEFTLLPWDDESAARFKDFRRQGIRIGTADLKIACIANPQHGGLRQSTGPAFRGLAGVTRGARPAVPSGG